MEVSLSRARDHPLMLVGYAVFLIGFVVFGLSGFAMVQGVQYGSPDPTGVVCGFLIGIAGMAILIASQAMAKSAPIPPPPPIQQPMVPAGAQGPIGLNCPACGAPAQDVDRFGVAVCPHCSTRFLVR